MNLEEFIRSIGDGIDVIDVDDELVIYQKDKLDIDSEIALHEGVKNENGWITTAPITLDDGEYHYLIEVTLAKEFLSPWLKSLPSRPSDREIARTLFTYAVNDY